MSRALGCLGTLSHGLTRPTFRVGPFFGVVARLGAVFSRAVPVDIYKRMLDSDVTRRCSKLPKAFLLLIFALSHLSSPSVCLEVHHNHPPTRAKFVAFLTENRKYKITDRGVLDWVLGMKLTRDRDARTLTLDQSLYVETACKRFSHHLDAANLRQFDVPASPDLANFSHEDAPSPGSKEAGDMMAFTAVYFSMIGTLIWLFSATRPELGVATSVLSRFSMNPAKKHFSALIRVFLYLRGHKDRKLTLGGKGPNAEVISVVTDSSHEEGPSLTGVMIVMGSALIDWFCRRQKSAVRNSTAAEAMANADGADHGVYIRELAKDFGVDVQITSFYTDNESSIKLHKDFYSCKKSKHIIRAISALRHYVLKRIYDLKHLAGKLNYADLLTKPLPRESFHRFSEAVLNGRIYFTSFAPSTSAFTMLSELLEYLKAP